MSNDTDPNVGVGTLITGEESTIPWTRYAEAVDFGDFWCQCDPLTEAETNAINNKLNMAAGQINGARLAAGMTGCTLSDEAQTYLAFLNIILAAAMTACPCGQARLSEEEQEQWLDWARTEIERIADGKVPLCQGDSGADFPYLAAAEINYNGFTEAQIVWNQTRRNSDE